MRIPIVGIVLLALLVNNPAAYCQSKSPVTEEENSKVASPRTFRPKLSLQDALKKAENFIAAQEIDISHFWLYRAAFILFGAADKSDAQKIPGWHFWWMSDSGGLGNYVEIFVSMDGNCIRLPSM